VSQTPNLQQQFAEQRPQDTLVGQGLDSGPGLGHQVVDLGHADGQPIAQQLADAPRVTLVG
jgi:hypothetical protein